MTFRIASAFALVVTLGAVAAACSSSSDTTTDGGTTGCSGNGSSSSGNPECGSCVQAHCSAQYNTCFGGGGQCSDFVAAGCKGLPSSTCQSCILGDLYKCQVDNCSAQCKTTTTDAGTGDTTAGDTGSGANCSTLAACCPKIDGDAGGMEGCNSIASGGNDAQCDAALKGYQSIGYCK